MVCECASTLVSNDSLTQVSITECTTMDNHLVAHFDLKPPDVRPYDPNVSGNYLTVYEHFFHLTLGKVVPRI